MSNFYLMDKYKDVPREYHEQMITLAANDGHGLLVWTPYPPCIVPD